ncbi:hypothetical protein DIPPA_29313 [Diplonema papillatum]|nr:hypothetical protein DIPPA_29313 [Diplonema papillatum]
MFTAVLVFVAAAATAVLPPPGTHLVEHTTIYLTKLNKTSPVELYYPADYSTTPVSFPVVVLSHGKQEGQPDTEPVSMPFPELIEEIVSRGAIVIALQTCLAPKCHKAFFDQLAAIDACRRNRKLHPALHKANFKNVALVGHGIGGQHTERCGVFFFVVYDRRS